MIKPFPEKGAAFFDGIKKYFRGRVTNRLF